MKDLFRSLLHHVLVKSPVVEEKKKESRDLHVSVDVVVLMLWC